MKTIELKFSDERNYFLREAFNTLRTNILFSGKQVKTIVVTSCEAHEGKTTISVELSRSLAEADKKVLLIDADLRKSVMLSRYTTATDVSGLSQLLSGQVELADAICHTQQEGMDVIFSGPFPPNPAELVGSEAFSALLETVKPHYDYVIIDAPPLGLVIDAAIMASVCDGSMIVINQGKVKFRRAQVVVDQLRKSGSKILGVVLNQTDRKHRRSGDSYYKHYDAYYGKEQK